MADDVTPRPISHGPNALWEMRAEMERLSQRAKQFEAERDAANASWYRMILRADEAEAYLLVSERRRIEQGVATGEANQRVELAEAERDALKAATDRAKALHKPLKHGGLTICAHCSGWTGRRCIGLVRPHPCPTLAALDHPTDTTGETETP